MRERERGMVRAGKNSRKKGKGTLRCSPTRFVVFVTSSLSLCLLALHMFRPSQAGRHLPYEYQPVKYMRSSLPILRQEPDPANRWMELVSWEPRAFLFHQFLSNEECNHLIDLAKPHMKRTKVLSDKNGAVIADSRTSTGAFLERGADEIVSRIERRIADCSFVPVDHGEGMQVLRYEVGQKYEPHYDMFLDREYRKKHGQRVATMIMYLTDVEEGGETVFPRSKVNATDIPWWNLLSECAKAGVSVRPRRGNALLFFSIHPDGSADSESLHGGCPVIKGDKWSATKWMRQQPLGVVGPNNVAKVNG